MAAPLLEESVIIEATPEKVWSVVSDLKRMGEWSPQCIKMIVRGGDVGLGTKTINVNKRGLMVWPTTSKVIRFDPNRELAFRVTENRTVWSFKIEEDEGGLRLIQRREVPGETTKISAFLVDKFMGGTEDFEVELTAGMRETLAKIKRDAEAA